jgi:hypothetical protein
VEISCFIYPLLILKEKKIKERDFVELDRE